MGEDYLRIDNLKEVIKGRDVAILIPGPSLMTLEDKVQELKDVDICYACANDFWVMEQNILSQIGKGLEIVMASAIECNVPNPAYISYLNRPYENIFITEEAGYHKENLELDIFKDLFQKKLIWFFADRHPDALKRPNKEFPLSFPAHNSLTILLCLVIIGCPKRVFLFGVDGEPRYYRNWQVPDHAIERITQDTFSFNQSIKIILNNVYETYQVPEVQVLNVSPQSKYQVFPKIDYDEAIRKLKGEEK